MPLDGWIRDYLNGQRLNEALKVYFWTYPYEITIVARDFVFRDLSNWWEIDGASSVLKFFPLAFMITDASRELPMQALHQFASIDPSKLGEVDVNLELIMPPFWPERPNRTHMVLGGAAFYDAICSVDGHFPKKLAVERINERLPLPNV